MTAMAEAFVKSNRSLIKRNQELQAELAAAKREATMLREENLRLRTAITDLEGADDGRRIEAIVNRRTQAKLSQLQLIANRASKCLQKTVKDFESALRSTRESNVEAAESLSAKAGGCRSRQSNLEPVEESPVLVQDRNEEPPAAGKLFAELFDEGEEVEAVSRLSRQIAPMTPGTYKRYFGRDSAAADENVPKTISTAVPNLADGVVEESFHDHEAINVANDSAQPGSGSVLARSQGRDESSDSDDDESSLPFATQNRRAFVFRRRSANRFSPPSNFFDDEESPGEASSGESAPDVNNVKEKATGAAANGDLTAVARVSTVAENLNQAPDAAYAAELNRTFVVADRTSVQAKRTAKVDEQSAAGATLSEDLKAVKTNGSVAVARDSQERPSETVAPPMTSPPKLTSPPAMTSPPKLTPALTLTSVPKQSTSGGRGGAVGSGRRTTIGGASSESTRLEKQNRQSARLSNAARTAERPQAKAHEDENNTPRRGPLKLAERNDGSSTASHKSTKASRAPLSSSVSTQNQLGDGGAPASVTPTGGYGVGRARRVAASKIVSLKEPNLNKKMRNPL